MKTAELKGNVRENTGAHPSAQLRASGKVPAVVYGESGVEHIEVDYLPVSRLIQSPDLFLINLEAGGKSKKVFIQEAQFHPVTDRIIHVDFKEAIEGKKTKMDLPVRIKGSSIGVMNGGQMVVKMRRVKVLGFPQEIPEEILIDITDLDIGGSIKVGSIEGIETLDPDNAVIVRVKAARKLEELLPPPEEVAEGEEGEGEEGEGEEGEGKEGEEKSEARAEDEGKGSKEEEKE